MRTGTRKRTKTAIQKRKRILQQEITLQYQLGDDTVRASEKDLLQLPQSTIRKYPLRKQKYWVATLKASCEYMVEKNTNMLVGIRYVLRRWAFVPD